MAENGRCYLFATVYNGPRVPCSHVPPTNSDRRLPLNSFYEMLLSDSVVYFLIHTSFDKVIGKFAKDDNIR